MPFSSDRLNEAISDCGKAITTISSETGISREQLYKYRRGEANPSSDNLELLSTSTNKPMDFFFVQDASDLTQEVSNGKSA
jgi:transcriptional regulator with XRE-family HTH domain